MRSSLQTLYSYWNEVRRGRIAPQRLEIEPSRIAAILSETFMLEVLKPDTYPYRLAGTRLCEMFGSELRGKNFLDGWSEEDRRGLESAPRPQAPRVPDPSPPDAGAVKADQRRFRVVEGGRASGKYDKR